ncbi:glycoside hydrolase superfamily [Xylariaceae sp. FL0016]|nr:glycoside hydrolase superfamily [Xylariaceae sp. FL0016]
MINMKSTLVFLGQAAAVFARSQFAGVNIAGFDFGADIDGAQNVSNSFGPVTALGNGNADGSAQMVHFSEDDGLDTFRLPVTWQFLINSRNLNGSTTAAIGATSNGDLNEANMEAYNLLVRACLDTGASCIVDIHNYARFEGQVIGQGGPSNAQFANLWSQIATIYSNETKVIFGVMNEPHDLPDEDLATWAATVQAAVTAIRQAGATTQTILLPGTDFTHAVTFVENGSAGNLSRVTNPDGTTDNLVFEVHQYLDADNSGTALECVSDHVQDGFMPLAKFLVANGRKAFVGEIGGGNTTSCLTNLCSSLAFINANPDAYMGYTAWSAGGFSATDYNLTETPMGSPGNFIDQKTVAQCVVGTRNGAGTNSSMPRPARLNSTSSVGGSSSSSSSSSSSGGAGAGSESSIATAGSIALVAGPMAGTAAMSLMIALAL